MAATDPISEDALHRIHRAAKSGVTRGRDRTPDERKYYRRCTHFHYRTGTVLMFTRDTGHHTSGWMKNPDYERCLHLSLSFRDVFPLMSPDRLGDVHTLRQLGGTYALRPFDHDLAALWVHLILGDAKKLSWEEGAFSAEGRTVGVRHWRVFCGPGWEPLKPRGEVYNTDFTEKGWKSWSELQGPVKNWVDAE